MLSSAPALTPLPGVQGSGRRCWLGLQVKLRQPRELLQSPPTQADPCHLPTWHLHYRKKWHGPRKPWCVNECTRAGLLGGDGQLEGRVSASQGAVCSPFHWYIGSLLVAGWSCPGCPAPSPPTARSSTLSFQASPMAVQPALTPALLRPEPARPLPTSALSTGLCPPRAMPCGLSGPHPRDAPAGASVKLQVPPFCFCCSESFCLGPRRAKTKKQTKKITKQKTKQKKMLRSKQQKNQPNQEASTTSGSRVPTHRSGEHVGRAPCPGERGLRPSGWQRWREAPSRLRQGESERGRGLGVLSSLPFPDPLHFPGSVGPRSRAGRRPEQGERPRGLDLCCQLC